MRLQTIAVVRNALGKENTLQPPLFLGFRAVPKIGGFTEHRFSEGQHGIHAQRFRRQFSELTLNVIMFVIELPASRFAGVGLIVTLQCPISRVMNDEDTTQGRVRGVTPRTSRAPGTAAAASARS